MNIDRNCISGVAQIVRKALNLTIPINLETLLNKIQNDLNIKCEVDESLTFEGDLCFIKDRKGNFKEINIKYLEDRPKTRILFSIAHELGHIFMHSLNKEGECKSFESNLETIKERLEANEFAAALLMPEKEFIFECKRQMNEDKVNISKVAKFFNVSTQAVVTRGNVLGIWKV